MYRLFIAANLPPEMLRRLADMQARLERQLAGAPLRWVRPEGIHLTLKFLGDTDPARIEAITDALAAAVAPHPRFELQVRGLGCFPHMRQPNVLWAGVSDPGNRLRDLAAGVDAAMHGLGWAKERRPYSGHLTLARVKKVSGRERRALGERLAALDLDPNLGTLPLASLHLMRSQLQRDGAVYSELAEVTLGRG